MTDKLKDLKNLSCEEQAEQIAALAAREGISLTEDDFRQFDGAELTDTELEQIAGGSLNIDPESADKFWRYMQDERYRKLFNELCQVYLMKDLNRLLNDPELQVKVMKLAEEKGYV